MHIGPAHRQSGLLTVTIIILPWWNSSFFRIHSHQSGWPPTKDTPKVQIHRVKKYTCTYKHLHRMQTNQQASGFCEHVKEMSRCRTHQDLTPSPKWFSFIAPSLGKQNSHERCHLLRGRWVSSSPFLPSNKVAPLPWEAGREDRA